MWLQFVTTFKVILTKTNKDFIIKTYLYKGYGNYGKQEKNNNMFKK